jgi:hypothetical protein
MMQPGVVFYSQPTANDPLASYERTALGDWPVPSEINRDDPWLRFVLLARERPVVIDVAVFIDGKPYADGREAWIDDALEPEPLELATNAVKSLSESADSTVKKVIIPEATTTNEVAAQARQAPGMRQRLQDYVATTGGTADRREVRWLISEWGFGPPLVVMKRSLSWQRAGMAPLLAILDADRSGSLDAIEIAGVADALRRADADANDVVDVRELERQVTSPPVLPFAADHPLIVALDNATDFDALAADCMRVYGMDADQAARLATQPADVALRVELGADASKSDAVSVLTSELPVTAGEDAITIELGAEYIECSAASVTSTDSATIANTQIAVGAAVDGNPLLRLADRNHDGRLTLRERQQLPALLASLDRDGDGSVAADEFPIPIRFAVTRGPNVHRLLAKPSTTTRGLASPTAAELPDWFLAMDANRDRDLSRSEFLGTAEQFGQFDADSDGLLSVNEALKMMPGD